MDAKIPSNYIRVSKMKTYITGNMQLRGAAYIICVCGRYFDIVLNEVYNEGKNIEVIIREYDDVSRYRKSGRRQRSSKLAHRRLQVQRVMGANVGACQRGHNTQSSHRARDTHLILVFILIFRLEKLAQRGEITLEYI